MVPLITFSHLSQGLLKCFSGSCLSMPDRVIKESNGQLLFEPKAILYWIPGFLSHV